MGCFSTCFPKPKPPRSLKPRRKAPRLDQLLQRDEALEALELTDIKQDPVESSPPPNKDDVPREKLNLSGRKKVTFDPNVKIYEGFAAEEESEEGDFLVKKDEDEKEEEGEEEEKKKKSQCHSNDSSSSSSLFSFPPNGYRYQDCRDSDDEFDQLVSDEESDLDSYLSDDDDNHEDEDEEVNNDHLVVKQESSESLFSLSVDSRKHMQLFIETGDKEVNSPMPVKTTGLDEAEAEKMQNFDSVLNPVENLSQWKAIKARAKLASQNKAKENKISSQLSNIPHTEEPILKPNSAKSKNSNQEIAVDASLSTWLAVGSEEAAAAAATTTPSKSKRSSASVGNSRWSERTSSPKDFEDRPILGALTMEEIKLMSAASTPRKSPIRNPDDMPIIDSVGSYWSHTGQGSTSSNSGSNTRSNFKQGSKVNFNSSMPFEKRLESVL